MGVTLVVMLGSPAPAETDLAACYGERLEVLFPASDYGPPILWSLPDPGAWRVGPEPRTRLGETPCLPEPVRGSLLWRRFADWPGERESFPALATLGVALRGVDVNREGDPSDASSFEAQRQAGILANGTKQSDGSVFRPVVSREPGSGSWLLPPSYPSPIGTRIDVSCSLSCFVQYRLRADVTLRYDFIRADETAEPDLVSVDRAVRAVVLGWLGRGFE